eukprot:c23232_g1_i2 orf=96-779(-)
MTREFTNPILQDIRFFQPEFSGLILFFVFGNFQRLLSQNANFISVLAPTSVTSGIYMSSWLYSPNQLNLVEIVIYLPQSSPIQCWLQVATYTNQPTGSSTFCMHLNGHCSVKWRSGCIFPVNNCTAIFTSEGNLELLAESVVEWSSNTTGRGGKKIEINDNGDIIIEDAHLSVIWNSSGIPNQDCNYNTQVPSPSSTHSHRCIPSLIMGISLLFPFLLLNNSLLVAS